MATRRLEAVRDYTKVVMGIAPHVSRRSRRAHALDWVATATRSWSVGWRTTRHLHAVGGNGRSVQIVKAEAMNIFSLPCHIERV